MNVLFRFWLPEIIALTTTVGYTGGFTQDVSANAKLSTNSSLPRVASDSNNETIGESAQKQPVTQSVSDTTFDESRGEFLYQSVKPFDGNLVPKSYERLKAKVSGDKAEAIVHVTERYLYPRSSQS